MAGVVLEAVRKVYPAGRLAVDGVSLRVGDGEFFVLLGPPGSGRSTLLRLIAGLDGPTSGKLWLGDRLANDLVPGARGVELLSGPLAGRAAVGEPEVLLLDEPRLGPASAQTLGMLDDLGSLIRRRGVTTVYVTGDPVEALALADRIGVMRDGRLEDVGTPTQLYDDPATVFVAGYLGVPGINLLAATARAVPDEGVVLHLGGQRLTVPWSDPRAESIAGYDGRRVTVGIRPDSLLPTGDPHNGPVISGHVRTLEYHGHEWLAHVEAGLFPVDAVPPQRREPLLVNGARPRGSCTGRALAALRGRYADGAPGHRPADLLARLPVGHGGQAGGTIHLAVDLGRVLVFDEAGKRVDPVRR